MHPLMLSTYKNKVSHKATVRKNVTSLSSEVIRHDIVYCTILLTHLRFDKEQMTDNAIL